MSEQFDKPSSKPTHRRSDILENQAKLRSILRNGSRGSKIKSELPPCCKPSSRPSSLDTFSNTYYGKCYEDHQVKLKLLELTPRNPAKETSEGVQEFIKQVSNFIEKKNPFKDNVVYPFSRPERNAGSASLDSVKYNLNQKSEDKKFTFLSKNSLEKNNELTDTNSSSYLENIDWDTQNTLSAKKTSEKISQGKKTRSGGSARENSQSEKKRKKGEESSNPKFPELRRVITLNENPIFYYENERRSFSIARNEKKSSEASNKQNQGKKRKPSEIPLRKNRKDGSKNPKPVSLFLKKPLKDVDSAVSIDFFSKKKTFSPIEELSLCSEIQITINAIDSSEKIIQSGKTSDSELIKRNTSEDSLKSTRLSRCCKNPNIPVESNFSCTLITDDQISASKKSKVLDLEKLKTSSFTVLRSNTTVLNRLESLHKRNVSSKEKMSRTSSKSKRTTSKSSFSSVKEKLPKNSLSFRLCGKGSKLNVKTKGKKNKNETEGNYFLPKKRPRTKNKSNLEICKEILAAGKVECLISGICKVEKLENSSNQADSKANLNTEKLKKESETNLPIKLNKRENKSMLRRVVTSKEKELITSLSTTPIVSRMKTKDFTNYEKSESTKISKSKSEKPIVKNDEKSKLKVGSKSDKLMRYTPPSTPHFNSDILETSDSESRPEEDDESSSKTVILDDSFNQEDALWCVDEVEARKKTLNTWSDPEKEEQLKESAESEKSKKLGLFVRGTSLNLGKDEPPEKPESADSAKVKMQLKIDLNAATNLIAPEEDPKSEESFDWLYMNSTKCDGELVHRKTDSIDLENEDVKKKKSNSNFNHNVSVNSVDSEITDEKKKSKPFDSVFRKPRKCCSSLKRRMQHKTSSVNIKGVRKKMRSDAGDRRLPFSSSFFNLDLSLQNKSKGSPKALKVGHNEDDQRDLFEDVAAVKLRRRNSEPHSFKEFVWKRTDFAMPKGLKPSVSSMASSLRHLNTDDIDDFIFWEPVPQKLTSCWETSLYHFKKPWTVLSCSVFKDNRQSNTPGLILQNLRNGGNLNMRQSAVSQAERVNCHKENPFDVEPSIAQKNIDIRNWLAALNFPTPPASSNEPMSEGNFPMQSTFHSPNLKNNEVSPKRRKILPNIKFSDETPEKKDETKEKYKASAKWDANEAGSLMELIRRKSGGFVTKEQFLNSEHSVHCPNVTVSFCVYSKSPDGKCPLPEGNDREVASESKMFKTLEVSPQPGVSISATIVNKSSSNVDQSVETSTCKEEPLDVLAERKKVYWGRWPRRELNLLPSDLNVWKYLFLLTLFIVTVHYCFVNSSLYHNQ